MIHLKKTLFQQLTRIKKRIILAIVCLGITFPILAEESRGPSFAEASAKTDPAKGKVYISLEKLKENEAPDYDATDAAKKKVESYSYKIMGVPTQEDLDVEVYLYADEMTNYAWGGWWKPADGKEERVGVSRLGQSVDVKILPAKGLLWWWEDDPNDNVTYTAKWLKPEVTGIHNDENELVFDPVTNPNIDPEDKSTTFQIKNYLDVNSFDLTNISPTCFEVKDGATTTIPEVDEQGGLTGELPITIQFKPTGVHNLNIEGQFTLESILEKTDTYNNHSQTITLKASENYTPEFVHQYNSANNPYRLGGGDTNNDRIIDVAIGSSDASTSGELTPQKENYAAKAGAPEDGKNGTNWSVKLENVKIGNEQITDAGIISKLFVLSSEKTDNPILTFNADRTIITSPTTVTAELVFSCIYYDADRNAIHSQETDRTYISIQVTQTQDVIFNYDKTSYNFNEEHPNYKDKGENGEDLPVYIGDNPSSSVVKLTRTNIDESTIKFQWWTDNNKDGNIDDDELADNHDVFSYSYNGGNVIVSVEPTATCGDYTSVLVATAKKSSTAGPNQTDPNPQILTVEANVELATPNLQAFPGDGQITLIWSEVPTATKYIIRDNNDDILLTISKVENTPVQTSYIILDLENDKPYTFTVQAENEDGCQSQKSIVASATPIVKVITARTAPATGIMTGTDHTGHVHPLNSDIYYNSGTFPYVTKRQIDVTAAFDANGKTVFDRLYIFGKTTGTSNIEAGYDEMSPDIAKTPCYIYEPNEAKDAYYIYNFTLNRTETPSDNVGVDPQTYSIAIHNSTNASFLNINADGQKYYLTGFCPYAYTGGKDQNGVIYINGSNDETIDLYFDNLQIYAKPKLAGGDFDVVLDLEAAQSAMADGDKYYSIGSGAVFVFTSVAPSTNAFKPNIHIRNHNSLDATPSSKTSVYIEAKGQVQLQKDNIPNSSAPIHLLPTSGGGNAQATSLTIDDIWFNQQHTYGSLVLQEKNGETSSKISIDLGNETNAITINGGHLYSEKWFAAYIASPLSIENMSSSLVTYGLGDTYQTNSKLIIQDGTFSSKENMHAPQNTTIDGGSFITPIVEPTKLSNKAGLELKRFAVEAGNYGIINNSQVTLSDFAILMDDLFPEARYVDPNGYSRSLSTYYLGRNEYGKNSLIADNNNKVYLMLPYSNEPLRVPWAVCSPRFTAELADGQVALGGPLNYNYSADYLLYTEIDNIVREAIIQPGYKAAGTAVVSSNGNDSKYSTISHEGGQYKFGKKVYLMKPVIAGDWTMFVPPFDVANVYVVEAYPDAQLRKDYGVNMGYGQYIIPTENAQAARYAQSQRWMDLYTFWYYSAVSGVNEDFNTTETNANNTIVSQWVEYEKNRDKDGKTTTGDAYTPKIDQLYHFTGTKAEEGANYPDGMKWWDANYYLYKSKSKSWSFGTLEGEETERFITDWEIVTTQSAPRGNKVIMKRGEIYTMQFPATVGTDANDWNYWTGKYIIFEGVGDVQTDGTANTTGGVTVGGSNNITVPANIEYPNAHVMGNASFANVTIEHENLFHLNGQNFKRQLDADGNPTKSRCTLAPMEGFLLANVDETTQSTTVEGQIVETQKIAKSIRMETGEVTYEIKTTIIGNDPGLGSGVPTIMNGMTLIVEPTEQGLTITPIKEQHVMLFDANGKMIFSKHLSAEENVTLPTGVYVVRGEYEQVKAIKK